MAWVIHYKQILLARVRGSDVNTTFNLAIGELRSAEENIVKLCQKEAYPKEYKALQNANLKEPQSNITKQLGLYMEQGMIKCRGRIQFADISESAKYPILLPRDHHVTQLLIKKCHVINKHYGINHVVAYMRQKWWIPKMRQTVKKVVNRCMTCKKLQAKPYPEINPPPLPEFRIQESEPFQFTGVDYTGAIPVKLIGSTTAKAYVVLFTCVVTRAIHMEIVDNLKTQSFIHALRRFTSRQGFPQIIISDNATTFVCQCGKIYSGVSM